MDRPKDLEAIAPLSVLAYIESLEEALGAKEDGAAQDNATEQSVADSWRKAYEASENEKQQLIRQRDAAMRQGGQVAFALERTEKQLREAHQKEGVLAAMLEGERAQRKAEQEAKVPHPQEKP